MLPQSDYNLIASGSNGYDANPGYNLVTGLGTPVANLLVPDLVAYQGPGTTYAGPTVGALQDATLDNTWLSGGGTNNSFSVFNAISVSSGDFGYGHGPGAASTNSTPMGGTSVQDLMASHSVVTPVTGSGTTLGPAPGSLGRNGTIQAPGATMISNPLGPNLQSPAILTVSPVSTSFGTHGVSCVHGTRRGDLSGRVRGS